MTELEQVVMRGSNLLVDPIKAQEHVTDGGVIIPEQVAESEDTAKWGTVLKVGPYMEEFDPPISIGDVVLLHVKAMRGIIDLDDKIYAVVDGEEVLMVKRSDG